MSRWNIVIAGQGWVYIGETSREGDQVVIRNCFNIRRWGTKAGLGELAHNGPTGNSELDYYGTVRVHVLAIVGGTIECDDDVWDRVAKEHAR
jgi:hypothetical protein